MENPIQEINFTEEDIAAIENEVEFGDDAGKGE